MLLGMAATKLAGPSERVCRVLVKRHEEYQASAVDNLIVVVDVPVVVLPLLVEQHQVEKITYQQLHMKRHG